MGRHARLSSTFRRTAPALAGFVAILLVIVAALPANAAWTSADVPCVYDYDAPTSVVGETHHAATADAPATTPAPGSRTVALATRPATAGGSRSSTFSISGSSAAKAADHATPIGPGPENAWKILDRVTEKGAAFPGYKGGKTFENNGMGIVLPKSNADGPITYREWDVNPHVKGQNRRCRRRLCRRSGGLHYECGFRGSRRGCRVLPIKGCGRCCGTWGVVGACEPPRV